MPALPDVPNVLRVDYLFATGASTKGGMRQYYLYAGTAPSNATCSTIASDIQTAFAADLNALMSNDFDLDQVTVTDLTSPTSGTGLHAAPLNGARAGNAVTIDTAVNLQFDIARRYRGGKPKAFLPFGITTDLNSDQVTWTNAFLTSVNTDWTTFDTAILAISTGGTTISQHVSVSYYKGFVAAQNPITGRWRNIPKLNPAGPVVDTVTGHSAKPLVSQQRRRRTSTS